MTKGNETGRQVGTEVCGNQVGSDGLPPLQVFMTMRAMKRVLMNPEVQGKDWTDLRRSLEKGIPCYLPKEVLLFQKNGQVKPLNERRQFFTEAAEEMRAGGWNPAPEILIVLVEITKVPWLPKESQRQLFLSMATELQKYKPSKRSTISYMNSILDYEFSQLRRRQ